MTMIFDAPPSRTDACFGQGPWQKSIDFSNAFRRLNDLPSSLLTKVIEGEIIPRLLLAHRDVQAQEPQVNKSGDVILTSEAFARLVLDSDSEEILAHVETLMDGGISRERIYLDLLAPVARRLGQMWEEDTASFTDVTLGLSRLHRVLHEVGRRDRGTPQRTDTRRAFFAPVPGEQHTFGISMLEEFFRHAGWQTACDYNPTTAGILHVAATQHLDVIGFSVGCQELLDPMLELIEKTREVSRNRDIAIMAGGGLFIDNSEMASRFGNATVVTDGVAAVRVAENLISRLRSMAGAEDIV